MSVIVGITGASGAIYTLRLLQVLASAGEEVHLSISDSGRGVLQQELGIEVDLENFRAESLWTVADPNGREHALLQEILRPLRPGATASSAVANAERIRYHHHRDFMAPIASGSFLAGGMVICPCSGTTLSAIAHAGAANLIQRAAEVQLKERRRLILVTRETPLSLLQIENMQRVTQAGAVVLPASPGWYHGVQTLADLVDFIVGRICDQLGIYNALVPRWGAGATGEPV